VSAPGFERFLSLPEDVRQILQQRARDAARRPEEDRAEDAEELLEVQSHGQAFALPLSSVLAITELSSVAVVPRAPPILRGLVSVRGEILVGVELAALVGGSRAGIADLRRVLVVFSGALKVAILAERILKVHSLARSAFVPNRVSRHAFAVGTHESFLTLLDPAALIAHVFQQLGAPA
jgi:purine-binding chemotaxis protein CheW